MRIYSRKTSLMNTTPLIPIVSKVFVFHLDYHVLPYILRIRDLILFSGNTGTTHEVEYFNLSHENCRNKVEIVTK